VKKKKKFFSLSIRKIRKSEKSQQIVDTLRRDFSDYFSDCFLNQKIRKKPANR